MQNQIKKYLEEAILNDQALASVYDPEKIKQCCDFITEKVKETYVKKNGRTNGGCYVEPEAIFKLARDYFIDAGTVQPLDDDDLEIQQAVKAQQEAPEKVDVESIKRQAIADFKAKEKEKAEAKKKAAEEARAKAALENNNQVDLFAGAV